LFFFFVLKLGFHVFEKEKRMEIESEINKKKQLSFCAKKGQESGHEKKAESLKNCNSQPVFLLLIARLITPFKKSPSFALSFSHVYRDRYMYIYNKEILCYVQPPQ